MRPIWNGSLGFGLINIPIHVYSASEEHAIEFHMLHKKDHSPIRYIRVCKSDNKEVPYSEIEKGYEYEKDKYIVLTESDFKAANAKKTSTIEIQQFAHIKEIDPIYFEKPYYLEPDKKAGKAYQLLAKALEKSHKVAIANYVFKNKEHLGVIFASKKGLILMQMRYASEIRSIEDLNIPEEKTSDKELKMALALIDQLTHPFKPESFHDAYTEELLSVIHQKLKGKKVSEKSTKIVHHDTEAKDLMKLLQASMKKKPTKSKIVSFEEHKKPRHRKQA